MTNESLLQQAKDHVVNKINLRDMTLYPSFRHLVAKAPRNIVEKASDEAALLAIQSAREEAAPKWIPVSESLPVIEEGYNSYTVLIYTNETYTWTGYYNHWKECWFSDIDEKVIVTHWMPLPDHPVVEFPFLKN